ncbi:Site-specific DNA methylase [Mycobacteroides abscessus subsp. bolletii]|uniref:DNA adenine methylase n=1 Tax=Mycobacteroides abscessus TaxID=36809 RepID=UPI0009A8AAC7|nr:DNA adenine methylase [Mycobacteroides abscessus]MBN7535629.1 DNA adenine methylase [Mycobacteroides abscessus subsp. abscessus]SLC65850.1 Site-specific DNA methylase [Mycobacteroides abscessus subsp. bolletii]
MTLATPKGSNLRKRVSISPLRYPGGKGSLFEPLRRLIKTNSLTEGTYVEPYAGGAGAALALLVTGYVERVVINDLDPAIYAFWYTLLDAPEEFASRVRHIELSVDEWERQKSIYLGEHGGDRHALGFSTFYLNRTNRSGVLNGGPIGGKDQKGNYKIDARFNRDGLLERIRILSLYSKRILVTNRDGIDVIRSYHHSPDTLIYADPPYFEKAGSLYMNSFTAADHEKLASCLNAVSASNWILTYDNVPQVAALYSERRREEFLLNYSAHRVVKASEIMVYSDAIDINY